MKKVLLLILSLFVSPAFASGINANSASAPCTNNTLETYSGNTNLQADWQPNTINIRWYNENERLTVQSSAQSCVYDGALTIPSTQPTRTGYTFAGWEVRLPGAYTELQYIETNHNAYIMSDLKVDDFDRVTSRVKLFDNNVENMSNGLPHLFGASSESHAGNVNAKLFRFYDYGTNTMISAYYNSWSSLWPNSTAGAVFPFNTFVDIDIKLAKGEQYIKINGETKASNNLSDTLINPYTVAIFAMNYGGEVRYIPYLDCEKITFYLNNNIVRNFIPARRNSDNVLGMYDTVTKTFFTNSGTGSFIAGPAVQ